ncbi:restriction endonuclease subunit S [Mycolicibacterium sp. PAM1]|uniref:restriction endonuclease subunit S n=1 Tax=Mycolicibacterium sp. PAM1 TaxID=2853535 RepID=UPI001C3C4B5E|nr:restriction endonuclease subunit S [Mycolicibacterium sp. PAM1]MBV5246972.1 restriction endonuclease subunit S [Mycolicibacterium sp. PAM1]
MKSPKDRKDDPSEIPGFGPVPPGWVRTRMDKHLRYVKHPVSTEIMAGQQVFHYSIPVVQSTGTGEVQEGDTIDSNKIRIQSEVILVSKLNPRKATVCRAAPKGRLTVCSTEFVPLEADGIDISFLHYVLLSDPYRQRLESMVESVTRSHQRVAPSDIYRFWWGVPPLTVQRTLVTFLDRETAKVDALIAKQEQLISTLREDRTATITHAVTTGLDRGVEFKAMGVDLPDVPNHWQVQPIKHVGRLITGRTPDTSEEGHYSEVHDGYPWFRPEDLDTTGKPSTASRWISESGWATVPHLPAPSVHVVSIGATLGKIGYVEKESSSNQQITAIVGASCPRFLYFALVASYEQIWASSMGNTIPIISAGRLGAIEVPVPPEEEQRTIVAYLDEFCRRVDSLILKAQEVVLILKEYRSALITDAVTGKIDVRGVA